MNSALLLRQAIEKLPKNGFKASSKIDVVSNGPKPNCVVKNKNSIINILKNINKLFDIDDISIKTINILNQKSISKYYINKINNYKEELIKIVINSLEYDLDQKINKYNNFSESNPMDGVSTSYSHSIENQIDIILSEKETIDINDIQKSVIDNKNNNLIVYTYNNTNYYDIRHVISKLQLKTTSSYKKYNEYNNQIKFSFWHENEFGGYLLRELIDIETIKNILAFSNSYGQKKLINILNITSYTMIKTSTEVEYGTIIIDSFKQEKCINKYYIGKYSVDLFFEDYNLIVECDEYDHEGYNKTKDKIRTKYIKKYNNTKKTFIRYDPYEKGFSIGTVINEIILFIYNTKLNLI